MSGVLVTGASGFVGGHLVSALAARGQAVTCLVRHTSATDVLHSAGACLVQGDVTDLESVRRAVRGVHTVYHLAGKVLALDVREFDRVNAQGAANVIRACAEQPQPPVLVMVSSLAAAGPARDGRPRTEADRPVQVSAYGRSKRRAERVAECFADRVPITVIRPPIVFGPRDRVSMELFRPIMFCGVHPVCSAARYRYSVLHVADLVRLLLLAAERGRRLPAPGDTSAPAGQGYYFGACETDLTYTDLGRTISLLIGRRSVAAIPVNPTAVWVLAAVGELIGHLLGRPQFLNLEKAWEITAGSWCCSAAAAIRDLDFCVGAPLKERLRTTAEWYIREGWLKPGVVYIRRYT